MFWSDVLHICQQQSIPSGVKSAFLTAVESCDKYFLLTCLLAAAQYGNSDAVKAIDRRILERAYDGKHTALTLAVEHRQKDVARELIPTEACMSKLTVSMVRIIMGDQLDIVASQITASKHVLFRELSERDVAGRGLLEYCILFKCHGLLETIVRDIIRFHLDIDLLRDAHHEPLIFLAMRLDDLDSFLILYELSLKYGLYRNAANYTIHEFVLLTGDSQIGHWMAGQSDARVSAVPEDRISYFVSASDKSKAWFDKYMHVVPSVKMQGRATTLNTPAAGDDDGLLRTSVKTAESLLPETLATGATLGTDTCASRVDLTIAKVAANTHYAFVAPDTVSGIGNDIVLQGYVRALLSGDPIVLNVARASFYTDPLDASANLPLAELTIVKTCGVRPLYSLSIVVKPPGTLSVQNSHFDDEKRLGFTPFSNSHQFSQFQPLCCGDTLDAAHWFLSASMDELDKTVMRGECLEGNADTQRKSVTVIPIKPGVDLARHNKAKYFSLPTAKRSEYRDCRDQNGRLIVLVDPSNVCGDLLTHMQATYSTVSDLFVLETLESYATKDFLRKVGWPCRKEVGLCHKHDTSRKLGFSANGLICPYCEIMQMLRYFYDRISGGQ